LNVKGYNGADPGDIVQAVLDTATEDGRIIKTDEKENPQDYLIEFSIKVTRSERI